MSTLNPLPAGYRIVERINENPFDLVFLGTTAELKTLHVFRQTIIPEESHLRELILYIQMVLAPELLHPNICRPIQTVVMPDGAIISTTPFYECGSIKTLVATLKASKKCITKKCFFSYAYQILMALTYLHQPRKSEHYTTSDGKLVSIGKVIHNAIRPTSILISDDRKTVYLGNLTECRENSRMTRDTSLLQTVANPAYASPEQLLKRRVTEKTDIWSLGATLYELYTLAPMQYLSNLVSDGVRDGHSGGNTATNTSSEPASPQGAYPPNPDLAEISDTDVRFLLSMLLCTDPAERISAAELLFLDIFSEQLANVSDDAYMANINNIFSMMPGSPGQRRDDTDSTECCVEGTDEFGSSSFCLTSSYSPSASNLSGTKQNVSYKSAPEIPSAQKVLATGASPSMIESMSTSLNEYTVRSNGAIYRAIRKHIADRDLGALLNMRYEIDILPQKYPTVLYLAAEVGWAECCRAFINQAKRNVRHIGRGYANPTAMMRAARKGFPEAVKVLLDYESGMRDTSAGKTALMLAAERDKLGALQLLIPYEVGQTDKQGNTALLLATKNDCLGAVRLLCDKENCIENRARFVSLLVAIQRGNVEAVHILAPYEAKAYIQQALSLLSCNKLLPQEVVDVITCILMKYAGNVQL